jgi:hypothetical protein
MRKILASAAVSVLVLGAFAFAHDHKGGDMKGMKHEEAAGEAHEMKGEIVDLACYMGHATKGPKHAKCALTCINEGGSMGLLSGDSLYVLVEDHSAKKAFEALKKKAGQEVSVLGKMANAGGLQAFIVTGEASGK